MGSPVAETILEQLGGRRFIMMTGAKDLVSDKDSLRFKLPGGGFAKDGINFVQITLTPADTYTVTFSKKGRAPSFTVTVVSEYTDVYNDNLRTVFETVTGLRTKL